MHKWRGLQFIVMVGLVLLPWLTLDPTPALAATLTTGSVALSTPAISATGVTYTLTFSGVSLSAIKCINVRLTDTIGSNSKPAGMTITSALLSATSNFIPTPASWTATPNNATGNIPITFSSGETPASASSRTIVLTGITNGSTKNIGYFVEVNTFNNTDCATAPVDINGQATYAFSQGAVLSGSVTPSLVFTVDATACALGILSTGSTKSCSHTMTAGSNSSTGYTISYIATTTLTSGANTIAAIGATAATSATNTNQFGLNLKQNTTPSVGLNPSGGTGAAFGQYAIADSFAFTTAGDEVASTSTGSTTTTYTDSYIANVSAATLPGVYTTTITYNVTANY